RPGTSLQQKTTLLAASNGVTSTSGCPTRTPVTPPVKVGDRFGGQVEAQNVGGSS
ncbi:hypothetical protein DPMN_055081, partial [Dreissena polymorpha]